jgi:hypothetical protein
MLGGKESGLFPAERRDERNKDPANSSKTGTQVVLKQARFFLSGDGFLN